MIPCTEFCVYQREGVCELDSAASGEGRESRCGYMVRRNGPKGNGEQTGESR